MPKENLCFGTLGAPDIDAVIALQNKVRDALGTDSYFLLNRTYDDWYAILSSLDYVVYGVFDDAQLVASGTAHFPNGRDYRDIAEFTQVPDTDMAIFQAIMVDIEYRGMGLARRLQELREQASIKHGRTKVICKISADNFPAWKLKINSGFHCVHVASDKTGHEKMYFIKKLKPNHKFLMK
jgi:GNAT superfamily N-acetyltransferase